jgi:hypothetical protein
MNQLNVNHEHPPPHARQRIHLTWPIFTNNFAVFELQIWPGKGTLNEWHFSGGYPPREGSWFALIGTFFSNQS